MTTPTYNVISGNPGTGNTNEELRTQSTQRRAIDQVDNQLFQLHGRTRASQQQRSRSLLLRLLLIESRSSLAFCNIILSVANYVFPSKYSNWRQMDWHAEPESGLLV
jgi:hypothetical protein